MQDDLESLGYTFLEMLEGDLPWDLTSGLPYDDGDYFSREQLSSMAAKREAQWEGLCQRGRIPPFLVNWHRYVRSLKPFDTPSYDWLFHVLQHSQDMPGKRNRESAHDVQVGAVNTKRSRAEDIYEAEE